MQQQYMASQSKKAAKANKPVHALSTATQVPLLPAAPAARTTC